MNKKKKRKYFGTPEQKKERATLGAKTRWKIYNDKQILRNQIINEIKTRKQQLREGIHCSNTYITSDKRNKSKAGSRQINLIYDSALHFIHCHICRKERKLPLLQCNSPNCYVSYCRSCYETNLVENKLRESYDLAMSSKRFTCEVCEDICECSMCINIKLRELKSGKVRKLLGEELLPSFSDSLREVSPMIPPPEKENKRSTITPEDRKILLNSLAPSVAWYPTPLPSQAFAFLFPPSIPTLQVSLFTTHYPPPSL